MTGFKPRSLEERIESFGDPVTMLLSSSAGSYSFPLPTQYSSFMEEQRSWNETVALLDMGQHMPSTIFKGPDVKKLFSNLSINNFDKFGRNMAKQYVFCREDGLLIGDGVVVALEDDEYECMGTPVTTDWAKFQIETNGYDVTVTEDLPTGMNPGVRRFYRYQLQGPHAYDVLDAAFGGEAPRTRFFGVAEFELAGVTVRAISHTMTGKPGVEIFGPRAEGPAVLAALRNAGRQYGMRESGSISTPSTFEAGWVGLQVPAIYSGECMKAFREWTSEFGFAGFASLGGSFNSPNIDDYYMTPWCIGYGKLIKFDHDFIGRAALEKMAAEGPKRQKAFFRWNDDDVAAAIKDALFGEVGNRAKLMGVPISVYVTYPNDKIVVDGKTVGLSIINGYSVNVGGFMSVGTIETEHAVDGKEVELVWGDADISRRPLSTEKTKLITIRATVHTAPMV